MQRGLSRTLLDRRLMWVLLLIVTLLALGSVLVPAWLIQPFKLQTSRGLRISYALHYWSPVITVLAFACALLMAVFLWNQTRGWLRRSGLIGLFLPLFVATWFARQNHFEWMFKPLPSTAFAAFNDAGFISDGDMVLGVELNGDVAAYPVRQVAYHHVVQDTIGGIPVLVTY